MTTNQAANDYLLKNLRDASPKTIYAQVRESVEIDEEVTRILAESIKKTGELLATKSIESLDRAASFANRSNLMHGYAAEKITPKATSIIFQHAADLETQLFAQQPTTPNSMDIHHFAGKINEEKQFEPHLEGKIISIDAPRIMPYATLLMNPLNPERPADDPLPLREGRMERHAEILSKVTGDTTEDHLTATFINVANIAGWRFTNTTDPGQVGFEYFMDCAAMANNLGNLGLNEKLFDEAKEEHQTLLAEAKEAPGPANG